MCRQSSCLVIVKRQDEMRSFEQQVTREQVLEFETAVYGLRNAPRAWWKRLVRDLTETGWIQHQLDECTYMFMNGTESLDSLESMWTISWWLEVTMTQSSLLLC